MTEGPYLLVVLEDIQGGSSRDLRNAMLAKGLGITHPGPYPPSTQDALARHSPEAQQRGGKTAHNYREANGSH